DRADDRLGKSPEKDDAGDERRAQKPGGRRQPDRGQGAGGLPEYGLPDHLEVVVDSDRRIYDDHDDEPEMAPGENGREQPELAHESDEGRKPGQGEDAREQGGRKERRA